MVFDVEDIRKRFLFGMEERFGCKPYAHQFILIVFVDQVAIIKVKIYFKNVRRQKFFATVACALPHVFLNSEMPCCFSYGSMENCIGLSNIGKRIAGGWGAGRLAILREAI